MNCNITPLLNREPEGCNVVGKFPRSSLPCLVDCRWLLVMVTEINQSQRDQNILGVYCCDCLPGGQLWFAPTFMNNIWLDSFSPMNGKLASCFESSWPSLDELLRKMNLRTSNFTGTLLLLWPPLCMCVFNNVIAMADSLTRL